MKPGEPIEYQGLEWSVSKLEIRGEVVWVLLERYDGPGKNCKLVGREWVPRAALEAAVPAG